MFKNLDVVSSGVYSVLSSAVVVVFVVIFFFSFPWTLQRSAELGNTFGVRWHLGRGSAVDGTGSGLMTPLMLAAQNGHENVLNLLLDNGADVNAISATGITALHYAAESGQLTSVKLLLENGANPNISGKFAGTPLFSAAVSNVNNSDLIMAELLNSGCSIDTTNSLHESALILGARVGNLGAVRFLVENGAVLTLTDARGYSALHEAVESAQLETVRYLLSIGCDVNSKGACGKTSLTIAKQRLSGRLVSSNLPVPKSAVREFEGKRSLMSKIIEIIEKHGGLEQ